MMERQIKSLLRSFRYAFRGIAYCIKNERNMRIHLTAAALVSYVALFYGLSRSEWIAVLFCFGFVIAAEALNTAFEAVVNLESPSYHIFAKAAKDVAAGAVLIAALTAAAVGVIVFWDGPRWYHLWLYVRGNPWCGGGFLCLACLGIWFVFGTFASREGKMKIYRMKEER